MEKSKKHYKKIGLLVLNADKTKFMVCEKYPKDVSIDYNMPGGQIEVESEIACIKREIKEELDCEVDTNSIKYMDEYDGPASGGGDLHMKLYEGQLVGTPKPSMEIRAIHWIGKEDQDNPRVSEFIRTRIFPALLSKGILK